MKTVKEIEKEFDEKFTYFFNELTKLWVEVNADDVSIPNRYKEDIKSFYSKQITGLLIEIRRELKTKVFDELKKGL